jgi:H/ACA ribonucleoprotein complex subunit 2
MFHFSAAEAKHLRRGLKEVTKALRKNEKGYVAIFTSNIVINYISHVVYVFFFSWLRRLVVIGGDVSPVDVLTHIPILCEDNDVPYVYVPSRSELGQSAQTKRATTLVLVRVPPAGSAYAKEFESLSKTVHNLKATVM